MPILIPNQYFYENLNTKSFIFLKFQIGEKALLNSSGVFDKSQSTITNYIEHYKNIYADSNNLKKRRVDYGRMKVFEEMYRKEIERLKTFIDFPLHLKELVKPLAKSGFYFIGNVKEPEKVKCIYCQGVLLNWTKDDKPKVYHKKFFPTCPFILNLNVGNEPLRDFGENILSIDPDLKNANGYINFNVVRFLDKDSSYLDYLYVDIETRERSFKNYEKLKNFAFEGLYVLERGKSNLMKCYQCNRETEILHNIEKLSSCLFHNKNCRYFTLSDSDLPNIISNQVTVQEITTDCKVEYSITDEEIEARMDSRRITEVEKLFGNRVALKHLIATRLKFTGKDYESNLELIQDLRNFNDQIVNDKKSDIFEIIFHDNFCVVCLDNPISVVFLFCGHMVTCERCSKSLSNCPLCRKHIDKRVLNIQLREQT